MSLSETIESGNPVIQGSNEEGFFLLLDKPHGYSSAAVVNILKKKLNIKKAGHSGTLDPRATGLMIICTGKKTKELNKLIEADKEYEGKFIIGERTKSFDSETEIYDKRSIDGITEELIIETAKSFLGETEQLPPMYSAVKFEGKQLYKYARKDIEVERALRTVHIKEFEIQNIELPEISFRVSCSKGTYIRTLVNDFGEKLGVGAYLKELRRTKIGAYDVKNSKTLDEFVAIKDKSPVFQGEGEIIL
jgi:tRNA pseudouridine55 synthase